MPVAPTYPGVYVQEIPSGVRTIVGVSTSTALFIGRTRQGLLNRPTLCQNFSDFERAFSADTSLSQLAYQVKNFFTNGGAVAWVMRIASGATSATVMLRSEGNADVLRLTAKQAGLTGETIRAVVSYGTTQPEGTFNLDLFRAVTDAAGRVTIADLEQWKNLSMNPASPLYAPIFLTQNSKLVDATAAAGLTPTAGFSMSGRPVAFDGAAGFRTAWGALIGNGAGVTTNRFQISVNGGPFVEVNLGGIDIAGLAGGTNLGNVETSLRNAIAGAIQTALANNNQPGVTVNVTLEAGPTPPGPATATRMLRIASAANGDVVIRPAMAQDAAVPLMLGAAQGGLEVSAFAAHRPAPTGMSLNLSDPADLVAFGARQQGAFDSIRLPALQPDGTPTTADVTFALATTGGTDPIYRTSPTGSATGGNDGVREKLGIIRDAINAFRLANPRTFFWQAELQGLRLQITPTAGADNEIGTVSTRLQAGGGTDIGPDFTRNVRSYSVGIGGTAGLQVPAPGIASDGNPPQLSDYDAAYTIVDREVDLFNLLILPADAAPAQPPEELWGPASVFCQRRRALLLVDPPAAWNSAQAALQGVDDLRIGTVLDHSALFWPRLIVNDNGRRVTVGPAGAMAGVMARIDGTRGVWKAPAGTEADIRGVVGVEYRLSDNENGTVNPEAVNAIRVLPIGIVSWGARTMAGADRFASEYKYIPVRRLALFIEESLYRGLTWVVFEPNDEPLWAQIRLNVGAFMHNLFRQGAFQGQTPRDAYFVKCDAETTTQNDRNLGIVNIIVGFAPLKPAEFVIISLQQMAGQIEV